MLGSRVRTPPVRPAFASLKLRLDGPHSPRFCAIIRNRLKYKYLSQDRENNNLEGEIVAKDRDEAYKLLRKQGIRPYRVIGDDPWNWRPWAISAGYVILSAALVAVGVVAILQAKQLREIQMVETEEGEVY